MKQVVKQLITIVCSIFILVYAVFQFSLTTDTAVETEHAFYSVVEDVVAAEGYIFRDETVIMQSASGTRSYVADDGEKVHLGQQLCVTYQTTEEAGTQDAINRINRQIDVLTQSNGTYFADLGKINDSIATYMMQIQQCVADGDLRSAERLQKSLLIQMNRREATVEDDTDYFSGRINALKAEKAALESDMSGVKVITSASAAGYFYTETDGFEGAFSAAALSDITLDRFKSLINTEPDFSTEASAVGKIAESSKWYLAYVGSRRDSADFEEGTKYTVSFPYSETEIDMTFERSVSGGNSSTEMLFIFSSHILPRNFNFTRKQEINIIKSSAEGLKIRTSALRSVDGKTGVYVVSSNRVVFKTAEVIKESGGFYLVKLPDENNRAYRSATMLSLHDRVVLSGKNLYEGKVLQ